MTAELRLPVNYLPRIRTGSSVLLGIALIVIGPGGTCLGAAAQSGAASWYGEEHRGRLMANGTPFDPDKLTAASWAYPLGAKVRVELADGAHVRRVVLVTITDRGPAWDLVHKGRVIDLSLAAFRELSSPDLGLVAVMVKPVKISKSSPK